MRVWRFFLLLVPVFLVACTPTSTTTTTLALALEFQCRQLAIGIVEEVQIYLDQFAEATVSDYPDGQLPGLESMQDQFDASRAEALDQGCGGQGFEAVLAFEAEGLEGKGPVGRPLAASLRGEDPAGSEPRTVELDPSDDLAAIVAELWSGSTINLASCKYDLD